MGTLVGAEVDGLSSWEDERLFGVPIWWEAGRSIGGLAIELGCDRSLNAAVLRAGKPAPPCGAAQLNLAFEPAGFVTKFFGGIF